MRQITRISPCVLTGESQYGYNEEIIVGADATRFRNGIADLSCLMGFNTKSGETAMTGQVIIGQYNKTMYDPVFIIGNGTSEINRSNIVEVTKDNFLIKKDLEVEGETNLYKLTTTSDAQITGNLEVKGTIKGTIQDSSGTSYVVSTTLDDYYQKTETYTQNEIDTLLNGKMNARPGTINISAGKPHINFYFQSSEEATSRINEDEIHRLNINGVICSTSVGYNESGGAKGAISAKYACIGNMNLDNLTTLTNDKNIAASCGIYPDESGTYNLGKDTNTNRWNYIYLKNHPDVKSDRNFKKEIKALNIEKYKEMYLSLKPCSYLFKDDKENKTHFGFIAQEVEESCNLLNEDKQYALYSKSKETGEYGMSYAEIIALNTCMIQHILLENENLKKEIQKLKGNS